MKTSCMGKVCISPQDSRQRQKKASEMGLGCFLFRHPRPTLEIHIYIYILFNDKIAMYYPCTPEPYRDNSCILGTSTGRSLVNHCLRLQCVELTHPARLGTAFFKPPGFSKTAAFFLDAESSVFGNAYNPILYSQFSSRYYLGWVIFHRQEAPASRETID